MPSKTRQRIEEYEYYENLPSYDDVMNYLECKENFTKHHRFRTDNELRDYIHNYFEEEDNYEDMIIVLRMIQCIKIKMEESSYI